VLTVKLIKHLVFTRPQDWAVSPIV